MENVMGIDEKKAYIARIEKKASDENITIKHAAQKLGCKMWSYYKYKADIKRKETVNNAIDSLNDSKVVSTVSKPVPVAVPITLLVTPNVIDFLEKEANGYATEPEIVAQLLLHDCVRNKIAKLKEVNNRDIGLQEAKAKV